MSSRQATIMCAVLACGCHDSLGLVGDARMDPSTEAPADAGIDSGHDVAAEPTVDAIVDPAPDGTGACLPPSDEGMYVDFHLDGDRFLRYNLELICTLEGFTEDPAAGTFELMLACRSDEGLIEEHQLFFQTDPIVPIDPRPFADVDLYVRYVSDPIFWTNRWVTVQSPAFGLLLAAVDAETVEPRDVVDWFSPLIVEPLSGVCPVEEDYCGTLERQALMVSSWDRHDSVTVFDGNMKPLEDPENMYNVLVSEMHAYHEVYCEDVPYSWVQAIISRLP